MVRHTIIPLDNASALPLWRQPFALLAIMAFAMPLAFATWSALLNNFVLIAVGLEVWTFYKTCKIVNCIYSVVKSSQINSTFPTYSDEAGGELAAK